MSPQDEHLFEVKAGINLAKVLHFNCISFTKTFLNGWATDMGVAMRMSQGFSPIIQVLTTSINRAG